MKYFVAYAYFTKGAGNGFGNIEAERSWPISCTEDIRDLTEQITATVSRAMRRKDVTLTIIGWQPFEPDIERKVPAPGECGNIISLRAVDP